MLRFASFMGEFHQAAARGPRHYRLVGDQFGFPALHRAGQGDPGSDLVAAGAGFAVDLVVGVGGQLRVVPVIKLSKNFCRTVY